MRWQTYLYIIVQRGVRKVNGLENRFKKIMKILKMDRVKVVKLRIIGIWWWVKKTNDKYWFCWFKFWIYHGI